MQKASGPKHSFAFRDKYLAAKKSVAAFILFLFIWSAASAQIHPGYSPTIKNYGNAWRRGAFDSALHFPNKPCLCTLDRDTTPQIFVFNDTLRGYWNGTFRNIGLGGGGGGSYTADESSIHLAGSVFGIKSTWTGQNTITTVGTITSGIWNSTAIADAYVASSANWNAKLTSSLNSAYLFIGNGSNIATGVPVSGDITISNTGATALASVITAGTCTNCNLSYDAKGRITVAANGTGGGSGNPFADNTALIKNNADNTRLAIISAASVPTATTNTYTLPSVGGTFDLIAATQTLTNKTIAAGSNTITGLTNSNLSGTAGISNSNLANSSVTLNGVTVALGGSGTITFYDSTLMASTKRLADSMTLIRTFIRPPDTTVWNNGDTLIDLRSTYHQAQLGGQLNRLTTIDASLYGFRINYGSDAGYDMMYRDSTTGYWKRLAKGSIGQSLQMLGAGGIGWAAQSGSGGGPTLPNTTNKYYNGYGNFPALNMDSIAQGASNLYTIVKSSAPSAIAGVLWQNSSFVNAPNSNGAWTWDPGLFLYTPQSKFAPLTIENSMNANMRVQGDSWGANHGLASANNGFVNKTANFRGWGIGNGAVDGSVIGDLNWVASSLGSGDVDLLQVGINDMRLYGYNGIFNYVPAMMNLVVYKQAGIKIFGQAGTFSTPTDWSNITIALNGNTTIAKKTLVNSSPVTFAIPGTVVYVSTMDSAGSTATYTVTIDGVLKGTYTASNAYTSYVMPDCKRFQDLGDSMHSVVLQRTGGSGAFTVLYVASNYAPRQATGDAGNKSYVLSIGRMTQGVSGTSGYANFGGSDTLVNRYNKYLHAAIYDLARDGLAVGYIDINKYYSPRVAGTAQSDSLHPADPGHTNIAMAVLNQTNPNVLPQDRSILNFLSSRFNGNGNVVFGAPSSSLIDNNNATLQVISNFQPQTAWIYDQTHAVTAQVGSSSQLDFRGLASLTFPSNAFAIGTTTDSVLVETTSGGVATIKKVAQSSISGGGGGGVSSVTGTTNRITSTGGSTPAIDISSTFEALLGKVANRIDQNNAATTSAQLATVISDESGTGVVAYTGSPAFTGTPTVPTATAGTNTTQAASTAFVTSAVAAVGLTSGQIGYGITNLLGSTSNFLFDGTSKMTVGPVVFNSNSSNTSLVFTSTASLPSSLGTGNTVFGYDAWNSTGAVNGITAIGEGALHAVTGGANLNTAVGYHALDSVTTGTNNTAIGVYAGNSLTVGSSNVLFGYQSGYQLSGGIATSFGNIGIGNQSLYAVTTGHQNIELSYHSGQPLLSGNSSRNILMGVDSATASNSSLNEATLIGNGFLSARSNLAVFGNNKQVISLGNGGMSTSAYTALSITPAAGDMYWNTDTANYIRYNGSIWLQFGSGSGGGGSGITALTGDVTASGTGSVAATLATVNSNVGTFGSATQVPQITVNAKGLTTAASNVSIQIAESQVTNLTTDLAAKAPLASPTFTGTPAAPTATAGTNTTQIATTAFVTAAISPQGDAVTTITSGTSSTVPNGTNILQFNNSSALTYTLTLPTTWHAKNNLLIALTGAGTVTLTIVNGSGQTLSQSVNPNGTTFISGEILQYHLIGTTIDQRLN